MKDWLTIAEAAVLVNRTPAAIYKWIQRGKLHAYPSIDRGVLVRSREVEAVDQSTSRRGGRPHGSAAHNTPRALT
jgi:excisionase family DNA binding protein